MHAEHADAPATTRHPTQQNQQQKVTLFQVMHALVVATRFTADQTLFSSAHDTHSCSTSSWTHQSTEHVHSSKMRLRSKEYDLVSQHTNQWNQCRFRVCTQSKQWSLQHRPKPTPKQNSGIQPNLEYQVVRSGYPTIQTHTGITCTPIQLLQAS
jgi:hypothetical protein